MFRWLSTFRKTLVSLLTLTHFQLKLTLKHTIVTWKFQFPLRWCDRHFFCSVFLFCRLLWQKKATDVQKPQLECCIHEGGGGFCLLSLSSEWTWMRFVWKCAPFKVWKWIWNVQINPKFDEDVNSTEEKLQVTATAAAAITTQISPKFGGNDVKSSHHITFA